MIKLYFHDNQHMDKLHSNFHPHWSLDDGAIQGKRALLFCARIMLGNELWRIFYLKILDNGMPNNELLLYVQYA